MAATGMGRLTFSVRVVPRRFREARLLRTQGSAEMGNQRRFVRMWISDGTFAGEMSYWFDLL
jgi:hypothetical protein